MLAAITRSENGYTACFERHLEHSVEAVWSWLTDNAKLPKWFPELRVDDLSEGGTISFDMHDGTYKVLIIIELKINSVLEYTWAEDRVRFELYPEPEGCRLLLIEKIAKITNHTPKDLAGWHVCLDVVSALLNGRTLESRENEWKAWYEKYVELIENLPSTIN
ncbi:activator of Hsp90 ATPase 1 family protein [Cohnella kolymensis]|uniref:Activator of Hsp90 ATPase 1 family protein n=1 Tax=Cohnella kolymensis TaxID=1590652 RepID=A0ABR5A1U3_9BACL|nr:SRPBCC family protein [Cohnella kolymensis]KIL35026.1 activator of Hsp90 ATPase 1 family protein [Cohnella kolymensis]